VTQAPFHQLVQTLGNGGEIEIAVNHYSVSIGSRNDSASKADILDDRQQIVFGYGLHIALPWSGLITRGASISSGRGTCQGVGTFAASRSLSLVKEIGVSAMPKTTNPRKSDLHLYRLDPVVTMHERDEWEASTIRETCFIWATSAQEARAMVEVETRRPQSEAKAKLPFFSPWSSSTFTSCEEMTPDEEAERHPAGLVFTREGPVKEYSRSFSGHEV
jgi:hypothetical protein